MANEFKVKKGLIVQGSGSTGDNTILDVQGNQGQLFSITDSLEGTLFTVSDISGIPILDVNSNEIVKIGTFGSEGIIVNGSNVTASAHISASGTITANAFVGDGSGITNISGFIDISGTPVDNDFAKFTDANTVEGRSKSEVLSDLDLEIGTDVQAYDAQLAAIAGLATTDSGVIVGNGSTFVLETGATLRTSLGVDPAGTDNSTNVSLSGTPDYITISGQTITRNQIDLANDVTGILPSANLDSDTAHLSGTQTFSGAKTFSSNITINGFVLDGNTIEGINDSDEFDDDDAHIMTSAGVNDRITTRISGLTSNAGTVTGVTSGNSNTITIGGTSAAPTVAANTAAVSNGGSNLATGDQIYDHVTTRISGLTSNTGTVDTTGTVNANEFARFNDSNTLEALTVAETKTALSLNNVPNSDHTAQGYATTTQLNASSSTLQTNIDAKLPLAGGTLSGNTLINAQLAVNSTSVNAANKLEVHGQARVNGTMMIGDSSISNTTNTGQLHIKNTGGAIIRLEDSDNSNLAFDLISDEGVGFIIKETVGGDAGDDVRLTIAESTGNATFAGTVTVEGGILHLGKADVASGHINAKELMTFNIDTDNDDTNRYFGFYVNGESGAGTELLKILETGDATFAGTVTANGVTLTGATDISGKQDTINSGNRLNANLIGSNGNISNTEYGYLNGVTSAIQTQLDAKQASLTFGVSNGGVPKFGADAANSDFLKVDGTTLVGRSSSEVLGDIGAQSALTFGISNTNAVKIDSTSVADNEYARFTAAGLESRSTSEVLSDIGAQATLTFGKSSGNALKSEEALTTNDILLMGTNNVKGRTYAELKSDLSLNNVENTAISTFAGTSNITTVGTIGTGTWQGTAIASAYLDSDTAHLSGTQTFSGAKTFSSNVTISGTLTANNITFPQDTNITIETPDEDSGNGAGGNLTIGAGNGAGSNGDGGDITIQTGNGSGAGDGGDLTLTTGTGNPEGNIIMSSANFDIDATGNVTASGEISATGLFLPQLGKIEWLSAAGQTQTIKGTDNYIQIDGDNRVLVSADTDMTITSPLLSTSGNFEIADDGTIGNSTYDDILTLEASGNTLFTYTAQFEDNADFNGKVDIDRRRFVKTTSSDGNAVGDVVYFGGTTSMTIGKIYYYTTSGTWSLADAHEESTASGMLGVALGTSSDSQGVLLRGMVTIAGDPGNVGQTVFLSTTPGAGQSSAPSGTGDIVRVIGYCLDASNGQIWFNPDGAFVEVA